MARRLLRITARNWVLSSEEGGWVTGRELESQLKLIQAKAPFFKLLCLLETRARKEDHLLEILHRFGLWSAKVRLEPNNLFLFIPLLVALTPSLVLPSTCFIFLFPLHPPMHALFLCCCLEASSCQCNTSPALFTGPSSGIQEENELDAAYQLFPFSQLQGSQGNCADSGAALRKLHFHLLLTWSSAITQQHDQIFFTQGMSGLEKD